MIVKQCHPSLIFASKAGAYPRRAFQQLHTSLLVIVRLGWKWLVGNKRTSLLVMIVKGFIDYAAGPKNPELERKY